jgi:molybdenum cofactor biosynthesis enzyme MoaA
VTKIRFTGGEPTINKDLAELITHSRSIPTINSVGITSNGLVLKSQLDRLCEAGLTHVNISLDTLDADKFASIVRRDRKGFNKVLAAVYAAVAKGLTVKINCVVMRGVNDMEVAQFADLAREVKIDVRFIELMPFDDNNWDAKKLVTFWEILDSLKTQVWLR